jgi:uncharacterized protein YkwD
VRAFAPLCLGLSILAACPVAVQAATPFEDGVMAELNRVRADPAELAAELSRYAQENGVSRASRGSDHDPYALEDAIDFLQRQAPLKALEHDSRLANAASDHVDAQGRTGDIGHGAPGSLGRRLRGHGVWAGMSGETISYGQSTPRDVVIQLVIDYGVMDRGHRQLIFSKGYSAAGVSCGAHAGYGRMCVINFAGAFPR